MSPPLPGVFTHEIIDGASGPAHAYSGHASGITTFNGVPVIILAATRSALVDAIKEINPNITIDASLFMRASIIHNQYIKRKDDEL